MHPSALRGWRDGCLRGSIDKIEALKLLCVGVALNDVGPRRALVDQLSQPTEKTVITSIQHFSKETPWYLECNEGRGFQIILVIGVLTYFL